MTYKLTQLSVLNGYNPIVNLNLIKKNIKNLKP